MVIQVNGKVRARMTVSSSLSEEEIKEQALSQPKVREWMEGKEPRKILVVQKKLVNIVVP